MITAKILFDTGFISKAILIVIALNPIAGSNSSAFVMIADFIISALYAITIPGIMTNLIEAYLV